VNAGVQCQLGIRQVKRKQALIATGGKACAVAGRNGGHQHAGIGSHQTQATPALDDTASLCTIDHPIIEPAQCGHIQVRTRLGKGTIRHVTNHLGTLTDTGMKVGEEGIHKRLLGACAHGQQRRNQCRQGQLAFSGKGFGVTGMTRLLGKRIRCNQVRKVQQELLYKFTVLRQPWLNLI